MDKAVIINYTNWKGETNDRTIIPIGWSYGVALPWHPEPQWLMEAFDVQKHEYRTFAMKDINSWKSYVKEE